MKGKVFSSNYGWKLRDLETFSLSKLDELASKSDTFNLLDPGLCSTSGERFNRHF